MPFISRGVSVHPCVVGLFVVSAVSHGREFQIEFIDRIEQLDRFDRKKTFNCYRKLGFPTWTDQISTTPNIESKCGQRFVCGSCQHSQIAVGSADLAQGRESEPFRRPDLHSGAKCASAITCEAHQCVNVFEFSE